MCGVAVLCVQSLASDPDRCAVLVCGCLCVCVGGGVSVVLRVKYIGLPMCAVCPFAQAAVVVDVVSRTMGRPPPPM
jgi:hypothetical protein